MTDYSKVTIAQGLRLAAKFKKQVADWRERAQSCVKHKALDKVAWNFDDLFNQDIPNKTGELANLKGLIAEANARTKIKWKDTNISLTAAIAFLSELRGQIAWIKLLDTQADHIVEHEVREWDDSTDKYAIRKINMICHLPEANKVMKIDDLQEEFDRLNALIEAANQTTYLQ